MFWSYRQIWPVREHMSQRKWKFDYITLLSCSKNPRQSWTSEAKKYAKFSAWVLDLSNLSQGNRRSCCFRNNDEKQVSQSRIAVFFGEMTIFCKYETFFCQALEVCSCDGLNCLDIFDHWKNLVLEEKKKFKDTFLKRGKFYH